MVALALPLTIWVWPTQWPKRDRNKMIEGLEIPDADDINAVKPDAGPSFDGEETDAMRKNREEVEAYEAGMSSEGTRIFRWRSC